MSIEAVAAGAESVAAGEAGGAALIEAHAVEASLDRLQDGVVADEAPLPGLDAVELPSPEVEEQALSEAESSALLENLGDAPTSQDIGQMGLDGAEAYLERNGHRGIVQMDGAVREGGLPDVISVTPDGRLCVTEAKGTLSGTALENAGLRRGDDPLTGAAVHELDPGWLERTAPHVAQRLSEEIASAPPERAAELVELRDLWLDAMEHGFRVQDGYDRVIVQTGRDLPPLGPQLEAGPLQDAVEAIRPTHIVQQHLAGGLG